MKRRMSAPAKIKPQPARPRAEIMSAYRAAHDRIRALLVEAATLDANRATFTNPFIGIVRVKVSSGFHIVAAHDRRHLWQAQQVVAARRAETGAVAYLLRRCSAIPSTKNASDRDMTPRRRMDPVMSSFTASPARASASG